MELFTPPQTFQGRTIAEAKARAAAALGTDFVEIGEPRWESEGGVAGFFEKRRVTICAQRAELIGRLSHLPKESALQPRAEGAKPLSGAAAAAGAPAPDDDDGVSVEISAAARQAAAERPAQWDLAAARAAVVEAETIAAEPLPLEDDPYLRAALERVERNPAFLLSSAERDEVFRRNGIDIDHLRGESTPAAAAQPRQSADTGADADAPDRAAASGHGVVISPFPELDMFEDEGDEETEPSEEPPVPTVGAAGATPAADRVRPAPVASKLPPLPPAFPIAGTGAEKTPAIETLVPLQLSTPSDAAARVEADLSPESFRRRLVEEGVPARLATELVSEMMLLGGPLLERKSVLRAAVARRFKPAPLSSILTASALVVCGERMSGKSYLTARMLRSFAAGDRVIAVASVGPMDDPGVETVRAAAAKVGVFYAWTNDPCDTMLKTMAKNSDLLIIDLHAGDPARTRDWAELQTLKRSLPGRVHTIATVPADAPASYLLDQVNTWPRPQISALAVTRADLAETSGVLLALAAGQKRPLAFVSGEFSGNANAFRTLDPNAVASIIVP